MTFLTLWVDRPLSCGDDRQAFGDASFLDLGTPDDLRPAARPRYLLQWLLVDHGCRRGGLVLRPRLHQLLWALDPVGIDRRQRRHLRPAGYDLSQGERPQDRPRPDHLQTGGAR